MRIRSITVGADSVEVVVAFASWEPLRSSHTSGLADRLVRVVPGLRAHRCDNGRGATLIDELADTELAHVLEHVALEVMVLAGSPDTLRGETAWDFARDGRGVFRVLLDYDDDLVCVGAVRTALDVLRWAIDGDGAAPDLASAAAALRALRRRPTGRETSGPAI